VQPTPSPQGGAAAKISPLRIERAPEGGSIAPAASSYLRGAPSSGYSRIVEESPLVSLGPRRTAFPWAVGAVAAGTVLAGALAAHSAAQGAVVLTLPMVLGGGALGVLAAIAVVWTAGERKRQADLVRDLTELRESRLQLAAALRERQALLGAVTEHGSFTVTDAAGRIIEVNDHFCQVSGYRRDELIGQTHHIVCSGAHAAAFWQAMWATISAGQGWRGEVCNRAKDGHLYWVDSVIAPLAGPDGRIERYFSLHHDITALKGAQSALELQTAQAELANAAKGQFLANMSHEIRTPLNAVLGMHHLLAGSALQADQCEMLDKAQLAGRALLGIVNNVLDLSKIEAGELTLDEVRFSPAELLHEVHAVYQPQASSKGIALQVDGAAALPSQLVGDALRVRQILTNLVGNAIKFTERGEVRLQASVRDVDGDRLRLRMAVRDTGIGIPADVLPALFAPFVQADPSTVRRFGGTGLGLSIVRQLAQAMGGEVGVTSAPGAGSEFYAVLPFRVAATEAADAGPLEILVIDGGHENATALTAVARALGWRLCRAPSADQAVALVDARARDRLSLPQALVVDSPPPIDGVRLALPIAVVERPVDVAALFNAVNEATARRHGHTSQVLAGTRFSDRSVRWLVGVRLLVVDDNQVNLDVARRILEREGAFVQTCGSGQQALATLRDDPAFDAVLMDVQMGDMDGLATTRRLRGDLGLTRLPVVALSAGALVQERQHALGAGMDDFLSKPLDPQLLVRVLRGWVESSRGAPLRAETVESKSIATSWQGPAIDGIDAPRVAGELNLGAAQLVSLLRRMLEEFADLAVPAVVPADDDGRAALAARAHKLAGGASQLGAAAVHAAADALEMALRRRADEPAASALRDVAAALTTLAAACAPAFDAVRTAQQISDVAADDTSITDVQRTDWLRRLALHDLGVLDQIEAVAPALRLRLGCRFAALQRALDELDFDAAHRLLRELA
jgi:PAS domain S-box-containing protein